MYPESYYLHICFTISQLFLFPVLGSCSIPPLIFLVTIYICGKRIGGEFLFIGLLKKTPSGYYNKTKQWRLYICYIVLFYLLCKIILKDVLLIFMLATVWFLFYEEIWPKLNTIQMIIERVELFRLRKEFYILIFSET